MVSIGIVREYEGMSRGHLCMTYTLVISKCEMRHSTLILARQLTHDQIGAERWGEGGGTGCTDNCGTKTVRLYDV
jgi:hypothetical protein